MSKISDTYDAVLAAVQAVFPNKTRIPNVLVIEANPEQYLRDGFGLKIDSESAADSEFCNFSRNRIFTILLSREVLTTEFATDNMDTAVKAMLEDVFQLQKDFMNPDQLDAEVAIEIIRMAGTSAVTPFIGEKRSFILMDVSFQIQITDLI